MARVLALSGTPGVGKTAVAARLKTMMNAEILSIGEFVTTNDLYEEWDNDRSTRIVDEDKARNALLREIERARARNDIEWLIVEGLMADIIADECDQALVLRLDPRVVKKRLEQRGYDKAKIGENVQSELLGTCTYHMQEMRGDDFADINTTGMTISEVAAIVAAIMQDKANKQAYKPGLVDWITRPDIDPVRFF
ncbi:MAG: AAA family ATPase [Candidatus Lokiarchaeota archaeon]|nr:AAA family ATPase [Candidatus Lokiarchaeota archaeon]